MTIFSWSWNILRNVRRMKPVEWDGPSERLLPVRRVSIYRSRAAVLRGSVVAMGRLTAAAGSG